MSHFMFSARMSNYSRSKGRTEEREWLDELTTDLSGGHVSAVKKALSKWHKASSPKSRFMES